MNWGSTEQKWTAPDKKCWEGSIPRTQISGLLPLKIQKLRDPSSQDMLIKQKLYNKHNKENKSKLLR